eukprot:gene6753-7848_t
MGHALCKRSIKSTLYIGFEERFATLGLLLVCVQFVSRHSCAHHVAPNLRRIQASVLGENDIVEDENCKHHHGGGSVVVVQQQQTVLPQFGQPMPQQQYGQPQYAPQPAYGQQPYQPQPAYGQPQPAYGQPQQF